MQLILFPNIIGGLYSKTLEVKIRMFSEFVFLFFMKQINYCWKYPRACKPKTFLLYSLNLFSNLKVEFLKGSMGSFTSPLRNSCGPKYLPDCILLVKKRGYFSTLFYFSGLAFKISILHVKCGGRMSRYLRKKAKFMSEREAIFWFFFFVEN